MKLSKKNIHTSQKCILVHLNRHKVLAFVIFQDNITLLHKLPPETCIFSAKTQAIYEAIILVKTITSNHILILSDSLSALLALQTKLRKVYKKILKSTKKNIKFMWVPSHVGITGNEMANKAPSSTHL